MTKIINHVRISALPSLGIFMGKRVASIRFGKQMHEKASHPVYRPHRKTAWSMFWAVFLSLHSHAQSMISLDEDWITHPYHRYAGIRRTADSLLLTLPELNQTHYLLVENPHLNHINFLQVSNGKWLKVGDSLPFSHRPLSFSMFIFPVEGNQQWDTVRLVLEKKGENLSYTIRILSKDAWESYLRSDSLIAGFITGCYLLVFMIGMELIVFFFLQITFMALHLFRMDESVPFKPSVLARVKAWENAVYEAFRKNGLEPGRRVCNVTDTLRGTEASIRHGQNNLGGMVTSALDLEGRADAAFINSGSIRIDDDVTGPISELDVIRIMPFGNKIVEVTMKGSLLGKILRSNEERKGLGGYLQMDQRIQVKADRIFMNGHALSDTQTYRIHTIEFMLSGKELKLEYLTSKHPEIMSVSQVLDEKGLPLDLRLEFIRRLKRAYGASDQQ